MSDYRRILAGIRHELHAVDAHHQVFGAGWREDRRRVLTTAIVQAIDPNRELDELDLDEDEARYVVWAASLDAETVAGVCTLIVRARVGPEVPA